MTPLSLVAAVAPRTGKIFSYRVSFERGEICYKMAYYTLHLS